MISYLNKLDAWQKTSIAMAHDLIAAFLVYNLAFYLRLGEVLYPGTPWYVHLLTGLTVTLVQFGTFYFMGLYKGIWRYSSTPDLIRLIKACSLSILLSFLAVFFINRLENIPRSIFIIDWFILICAVGGGRLAYRVFRDQVNYNLVDPKSVQNVLIIGASDSGDQLFREIRHNPSIHLKVVGFIDDDPSKRKKQMHGVPVIGTSLELPQLIEKHKAFKIFIAIPTLPSSEARKMINSCKGLGADFKILPKLSSIIDGSVSFSQLRKVGPEDILGRKEVSLDLERLDVMINNKKVLITGAGGSIGSELCKQISRFTPQKIILFDQSEFNIFKLENDLKEQFPKINVIPFIGDIRQKERIEAAFKIHRPELVFHAAAYKHVPLMESNSIEAVYTNIQGTKNLTDLAIQYQTSKFVLISSDKAVNPTNIMGASKRIAEMVTQYAHQSCNESRNTQFMMVRFGNVLGSSGSVIPIFQEQIRKGGPVTVTHPEIKRFFMTIPEACQLVLQAGSIGVGGEVFVLDMGEPVKIIDVAKELINLNGLILNEDIKIKFTGLRPGEKLYEEMFFEGEGILPTPHPLIKIAKAKGPADQFKKQLNFLFQLSLATKPEVVKSLFMDILDEYCPTQKEREEEVSENLIN